MFKRLRRRWFAGRAGGRVPLPHGQRVRDHGAAGYRGRYHDRQGLEIITNHLYINGSAIILSQFMFFKWFTLRCLSIVAVAAVRSSSTCVRCQSELFSVPTVSDQKINNQNILRHNVDFIGAMKEPLRGRTLRRAYSRVRRSARRWSRWAAPSAAAARPPLTRLLYPGTKQKHLDLLEKGSCYSHERSRGFYQTKTARVRHEVDLPEF